LRDFALSESEAAPILAAYNARCTPALAERELQHTLQSAQKYGLGVRGSKLDGDTPKRAKVWEPSPPKATTDDDLDFDGSLDMAEMAQMLVAQARELTKQDQIKLLFRSIEAVNAGLDRPLGPNELKAVFTFALRQERSKRLDESAVSVLTNPPEAAVNSAASALAGRKASGVFKLVIVHSDPPRYELHAPQFDKAAGKCIVLTAEQMTSSSAIRVQALKQAEYPLPKVFDKEWSKAGGIYEAVVHMAEHRDAPSDSKRSVVVAEMLLAAIERPKIIEEGKEPDTRGKPCLMPNGEVVCKFNHVWEPMRRSEDKVERMELSNVFQAIKATYENRRVAGKQHKFLVISPSSVRSLRLLCEVEE
jgi:hypothetical protein